MRCAMWKQLCLPICIFYLIVHLSLHIYSIFHVSISPRQFTKKELYEGPLIRQIQMPGSNKRIKTISGVYVVNAHSAFDQPMPKTFDLKPFNESAPLPVIPTEFFKELRLRAKNILSKKNRFVYFTMINSAYADLTLNWLCNAASFRRTIIVSTSAAFCKRLKKEWRDATCLTLRLGSAYEGSLEWGRQQYINILTLRAQIMLKLVEHNVPFVLFESDAVWLKDPYHFFEQQDQVDDADIVVPTKGYTHKGQTISFDPMIVYPTNGSQTLFRRLTQMLMADRKAYDQDVLEQLCKTQYNGVICRQFEYDDIADGKWFKLSENERFRTRPYIVNNNYYVGVENKMARQAMNGFWFLSKMQHCISLKVSKSLKKYNGKNT